MESPLRIKDPVFAAFLLSRGWELLEVEPSSKEAPTKYYLFDGAVKTSDAEKEFLGINAPMATTKWHSFITMMNKLLDLEDLKLRQISNRANKTGVELHQGEARFVTADQAVAAFLLSEGHSVVSVQQLGKDKGFTFIFNCNSAIEKNYQDMLNKDNFLDTWWNMKCAYKLATSIRRKILRNDTQF